MKDYYKELSLDQTKTAEELLDDLYVQRKKWMQRQNASSIEKQQKAKEMVRLIDEAQDVFETEESKSAYDKKLSSSSGTSSGSYTNSPTGGGSSSTSSGSSTSRGNSGTSSGSYTTSGSSSTGSGSSYTSSGSSTSSGSYTSSSSSGGSSSSTTSSSTSTSSSTRSGSTSSSGSSYNSNYQKKKKKKFPVWLLIAGIAIFLFVKRDQAKDWITSGKDTLQDIDLKKPLQIFNQPKRNIPDDAVEFNGHYYYLYDGAASWFAAEEACEKNGGHLATITSEEEDTFVYSYMIQQGYNTAFLGLYRTTFWDPAEWAWVTEEEVSYTRWGEGEPNNDNLDRGGEPYSEYFMGAWNDCLSTETKSYLCEWEPDDSVLPPANIAAFNGHIYGLFSDAKGWKDAKEKAERMGGYLACIGSEEENAVLLKLLRRTGNIEAYFGFFNSGRNGDEYLYSWVSGEEVTYTDWSPGQPDNWQGNEYYGTYYLEDGHWNDAIEDGMGLYLVEWDTPEACDYYTIADPAVDATENAIETTTEDTTEAVTEDTEEE